MIHAIWQEMRPTQWTKNVLVYAALLFDGELFAEGKFVLASVAFASFCLISSSVYFFNDIVDADMDRKNPKKCHRPIAEGKISIRESYLCAFVISLSALVLAHYINWECFFLIAAYVVMNICYTLRLKHVVIVDVMIIAVGFVFRALMGAFAINVHITSWFLLCVMFLSLFLALGKRRHELSAVEDDTISAGRKVLRFYSIELIDQLMTIVTSMLLICYALFAVDASVKNHENMAYTIPLVLYGMFYYLYVVRVKRGGGAPDEALYREKPLLAVVILYLFSVILIRNI